MQSIQVIDKIGKNSEDRQIQILRSRKRPPILTLNHHNHNPPPKSPYSKSETPKRYLSELPKTKKKRSYASQYSNSRQTSSRNRPILQSLSQTPINNSKILPHVKNQNQRNQTYVQRYEQQKQARTVLSIRFASEDKYDNITSKQEAYIQAQNKDEVTDQEEEQKLPYIKYRKYISPEQQLKEMGYNPDTRLASQIYLERVEQKKNRYVNKIQALKRQLQCARKHPKGSMLQDARRQHIQKNRIQVKILQQQIRRNRERELIRVQQRRGRKLLQNLLKNSQQQQQ